jgi:hypothetical protein
LERFRKIFGFIFGFRKIFGCIFQIYFSKRKSTELLHGHVDRVHGRWVYGSTNLIKPEPFTQRWRAQILYREGVTFILILTIHDRLDGPDFKPPVCKRIQEVTVARGHKTWRPPLESDELAGVALRRLRHTNQ